MQSFTNAHGGIDSIMAGKFHRDISDDAIKQREQTWKLIKEIMKQFDH